MILLYFAVFVILFSIVIITVCCFLFTVKKFRVFVNYLATAKLFGRIFALTISDVYVKAAW